MRIVLTTLLALVGIGSGLFFLLASFAQGMSDAPSDDSLATAARVALVLFLICMGAIFEFCVGKRDA